MTRTMFDAIGENSAAIPSEAEMVAGYPRALHPGWAWTRENWARFPNAAKVRIASVGEDYDLCAVVDREAGALTNAQARDFVVHRNRFRAGTATVYCDWANVPQLLRACGGLDYHLWLAWWIGAPPSEEDIKYVKARLTAGVSLAAWQYVNRNVYDESVVFDDSWHPQPAPRAIDGEDGQLPIASAAKAAIVTGRSDDGTV